MHKTFEIIICGQVQGVGFRPFVYNLAISKKLKGFVSNNEKGVLIQVSGGDVKVQEFFQELNSSPPQVSIIEGSEIYEIESKNFSSFDIKVSKKGGKLNLPLTPDFAICSDCKNEIVDPKNRRDQYPFTTCVKCGPRWAITNIFPFERNHTSIDEFPMCESCLEEYENPLDRRFHSQTNTCSKCGIEICLKDAHGKELQVRKSDIFAQTAELIKSGNIVAIKNTSGYLLCCDANNPEVIQQLRDRKHRPAKPFAILYPNLSLLENHVELTQNQRDSFQSPQCPIVIIQRNTFKGNIALDHISPRLNQLGVMIPYTGILHLLSKELNIPIIATSGNLHGSPIISANEEAEHILSNVADYFLNHNLTIENPQDDSVLKFSTKFEQRIIFRRSRGYAPNYLGLKIKFSEGIIAMGGHLKNTIALLPNDFIYVSQYLGNLDDFNVFNRFVETCTKFIDIFENEPSVVLTDLHPGYHSSQYGEELSNKLKIENISIQHHKAHFASVLGEHQLFDTTEPILGVIWDGTGFGEDQQIWGGEFFSFNADEINRICHFEYFDWLAGDKMSKEPRLSLLSLLEDESDSILLDKFSAGELKIYSSLRKRNKLKTSSVGRLFDAVASLLNICDFNTYEGEAAILMENLITEYDLNSCKSYFKVEKGYNIQTRTIFKNIYLDYKRGVNNEIIIKNFLFTLANNIFELAENNDFHKIAFSGGVFQNSVLVDMIIELNKNKYDLYFNCNLAPNDENISFGQMMYYLNFT